MITWLVPLLLSLSAAVMALAWLGHMRFKHWSYAKAMAVSWMLVLPEYFLNVYATRLGHGEFSGAQMATFHLASGVVCVAAVSRWYLREPLLRRQLAGFAVMVLAVVLIMYR